MYIAELAEITKKARSTFWRLVIAGHTYNALRAKFEKEGDDFPPLAHIDNRPASESLELVSKIQRVAPAAALLPIERQVMMGLVGRDELRAFWGLYKPVLGGKTKRGRGVAAPRYDKQIPAMLESMSVANATAMMVEHGPTWLGIDGSAYLYRIINSSGSGFPAKLWSGTPDVIVLFAETWKTPLALHGVEIGGGLFKEIKHPQSINVDFLWYAKSNVKSDAPISGIPDWVGILDVTGKTIKVVRSASPTPSGPQAKENLLRLLVLEMARR